MMEMNTYCTKPKQTNFQGLHIVTKRLILSDVFRHSPGYLELVQC